MSRYTAPGELCRGISISAGPIFIMAPRCRHRGDESRGGRGREPAAHSGRRRCRAHELGATGSSSRGARRQWCCRGLVVVFVGGLDARDDAGDVLDNNCWLRSEIPRASKRSAPWEPAGKWPITFSISLSNAARVLERIERRGHNGQASREYIDHVGNGFIGAKVARRHVRQCVDRGRHRGCVVCS